MRWPAFGPKPIAEYEPYTRAMCRELLDAIDGKDELDAAVDYAQHIPVRLISKMLGFPDSDADLLRSFGLAVHYSTLTLGTNPGFVEEAFYGHMHEDSSRVAALFQARPRQRAALL